MRSVVLLSGGLDSVVNLKLAADRTKVVLALTFDYGQAASANEIEAARQSASLLAVPHMVVSLDWYGSLLPSQGSGQHDVASMDSVYPKDVWVPNRNAVFLSIGAAFAEKLGAEVVVMGLNREEACLFPDNSAEFIEAANRMLTYSTSNSVKLVSYTASLSKSELVALGLKIGAPLDLIYSCYLGSSDNRMCGECRSCMLLKQALMKNKILERFETRFVR